MFQSPNMKLLNFEQFQNMLNQIQISQLSDTSISPKSCLTSQTSYLILNDKINRKSTNRNSLNNNQTNTSQNTLKTKPSDINLNQSRGISPRIYNPTNMDQTRTINSSCDNNKYLRPSNSNQSIPVQYSSRSTQMNNQQQNIQQSMNNQQINYNLRTLNTNPDIEYNYKGISTVPTIHTVERGGGEFDNFTGMEADGLSCDIQDETLQMKELSCSMEQQEEQELSDDKLDKYNNNNNHEDLLSYQNNLTDNIPKQSNQNLINRNINNKNQNNPTMSKSNSQKMLDPLLQNLNVKKMCEVQKHFCKKRIREFKQPCEDIIQYQEFIQLVNQRGSKENAIPQPSNRRIKTDHSVNSLKNYQQQQQQQQQLLHKPPTHQNTNYLLAQQQNMLNNTIHNNSTNNQFVSNRGKQQLQNLPIPQNILRQQNINNANNISNNNQNNFNNNNSHNNSQYSQNHSQNSQNELTSKIFKMKKKTYPSLQDNIAQSIASNNNNTINQNQFNSNKENNLSNISSNRNSNKNHTNNNNINNSYNFNNTNLNPINQSGLAASRNSPVCNYESKNSRNGVITSKNQQHKLNILPSAVVNCPNIFQQQSQQSSQQSSQQQQHQQLQQFILQQPQLQQQQQHQQNQKQKSLSPFYSRGMCKDKEIQNNNKSVVSRESRINSTMTYSNRNNNNNNFNLTQANKFIFHTNHSNTSSVINQQNILPPPISSRSRLSTVEVPERMNYDCIPNLNLTSQNKNNTNSSLTRQYVSKSSDIQQQYSQNNNTNGQIKNIVTFGQSYYKRQQQQAVKAQKNLKHLNFNCLGYIRKYKEILENQILQGISKIPKDNIIEYQQAYKQSICILNDEVELINNDDLNNYQDFLTLRSKNIFNQFLTKIKTPIQI